VLISGFNVFLLFSPEFGLMPVSRVETGHRLHRLIKEVFMEETVVRESSFMEILTPYDYTRDVFVCFTIISLVIIINNIINLVKARRFLADGSVNADSFKRFLFWPKGLKFLAILTFLIGLCISVFKGMCSVGMLKTKLEPAACDVFWGIEEALFPLFCSLFITTCLFVLYGVFRLILHRMYQRSLKQ
jgi:hypothetical protein